MIAGLAGWVLMPFGVATARGLLNEGRALRAHYARVWCYGLPGLGAAVIASAAVYVYFGGVGRGAGESPDFHIRVDPTLWACPLMALWAWLWWDRAAGLYFRWDKARTLATMAVVASFGTALGVVWMWDRWELVVQAW
jgi:hypothetical protein